MQQRRHTVAEAVDEAAESLGRAGVADGRRQAELLLGHLIGTDRGGVVARRPERLPEETERRFRELWRRRERREPLQHLIGATEFYGLEIGIDRRALVPRPETEGLVDAVLAAALPEGARVLDLGTGSGCIALALAAARGDLVLVATDRSAEALALADENARRLGLASRVELVRADLAEPPATWRGTFDAVVSNPPYVSEGEWRALMPEVRDHDPREALVAGPTGLEAYRALAPVASGLLTPKGLLALELGAGQEAGVRALVESAGFEAVRVLPDLAGIPRVLTARKPGGREGP